jgi:hypothetical protein
MRYHDVGTKFYEWFRNFKINGGMYRVFQKELYNFESLYIKIYSEDTYSVLTVIM